MQVIDLNAARKRDMPIVATATPVTTVESLEAIVAHAAALVAKADQTKAQADAFYKEAGLRLAECKRRCEDEGRNWARLCNDYFGIYKLTRANELIAIAEGRTTVEEQRQKNRDRQQRHRQRKTLRNVCQDRQDQPPVPVANTDTTAQEVDATPVATTAPRLIPAAGTAAPSVGEYRRLQTRNRFLDLVDLSSGLPGPEEMHALLRDSALNMPGRVSAHLEGDALREKATTLRDWLTEFLAEGGQ
jgi:hypothetical protein